MKYYQLNISGVQRKLPVVAINPKVKVASLNLLGDTELVCKFSKILVNKLKSVGSFDYLVGPEVKVVPVLQELSNLLGKKRYVVCRKRIHAYMVSPLKTRDKYGLVLNGVDAKLIKNKKVVIVDDVVSTGSTIYNVEKLIKLANAKVVAKVALFVQGERLHPAQKDLIYLDKLPVFSS